MLLTYTGTYGFVVETLNPAAASAIGSMVAARAGGAAVKDMFTVAAAVPPLPSLTV